MKKRTPVSNPLEYYLTNYCNVNAVDLRGLHALFVRPDQTENANAFLEQLNAAIAGSSLLKKDYERWTGQDFDTQEDLIAWLKVVRGEVFDRF